MPHCNQRKAAQLRQQLATAEATPETPGELDTNDVNTAAAHSASWEHFSDYINVDYDCIDRTNTCSLYSALEVLCFRSSPFIKKTYIPKISIGPSTKQCSF